MAVNEEYEVLPQPVGEKAKHILFWIAFGLATTVVMLIDSPYNLKEQSTIMIKSETVSRIKSARNTFKGWPLDDTDSRFGFGDLATIEAVPPRFQIVTMYYDEKDHRAEKAVYSFEYRGLKQDVLIRWSPSEIPKKRFF